MNAPRIITIVVKGGNHFDVHEGERYADHLCWEEMLGQIATITHPMIDAPRFRMTTPEEEFARRERWAGVSARRDEERAFVG